MNLNLKARVGSQTLGIGCVMLAGTSFATGDMLVKFLSGGYPLHQIIWFRATIAIIIVLAVFVPLEGGYRTLLTRRWPIHFLRGSLVVIANASFFVGIAAMPLPEVTSIFFVAPLLITALSVPFLGEKVGVRRWTAVLIGFLGVAIVVRPGTDAFQVAAFAPIVAAFAYAAMQILGRKIGGTEKASTMAFYMQFTFLIVTTTVFLIAGDGQFVEGFEHPSMIFLLRAWAWPAGSDWIFLGLVGVTTACGSYLISQAYRQVEATTAAPFEYVALPAAIFWSVMVFDEWPDMIAALGILLIVGSGIYAFRREGVRNRVVASKNPVPRHR